MAILRNKRAIPLLLWGALVVVGCVPAGSSAGLDRSISIDRGSTATLQPSTLVSMTTASLVVTTPVPSPPEFPAIWQTYNEAGGSFTIDYPDEWLIEEPNAAAELVRIWQFRGPPMSVELLQSVTVGHYTTPTIDAHIPLAEWITQSENQEFAFERIASQPTELKGLDAYVIHDRVTPPTRDVYVTYIRCNQRVWFLQTLDIDPNSDTIERIYERMLASFDLACE